MRPPSPLQSSDKNTSLSIARQKPSPRTPPPQISPIRPISPITGSLLPHHSPRSPAKSATPRTCRAATSITPPRPPLHALGPLQSSDKTPLSVSLDRSHLPRTPPPQIGPIRPISPITGSLLPHHSARSPLRQIRHALDLLHSSFYHAVMPLLLKPSRPAWLNSSKRSSNATTAAAVTGASSNHPNPPSCLKKPHHSPNPEGVPALA